MSSSRHRFKKSADHDNQQRDGNEELPIFQSRQPATSGTRLCTGISPPHFYLNTITLGPPKKPLKKFSHAELNLATNNFSDDKKIGEGEFGSVYKGELSDLNLTVAVKKIPRVSKERKKVYVQAMTDIRTILHDKLVQLIGWSYSYNPYELMLVYEFMPNGNLHNHLFGKKRTLDWQISYETALGLAYALLFLHEEWKMLKIYLWGPRDL